MARLSKAGAEHISKSSLGAKILRALALRASTFGPPTLGATIACGVSIGMLTLSACGSKDVSKGATSTTSTTITTRPPRQPVTTVAAPIVSIPAPPNSENTPLCELLRGEFGKFVEGPVSSTGDPRSPSPDDIEKQINFLLDQLPQSLQSAQIDQIAFLNGLAEYYYRLDEVLRPVGYDMTRLTNFDGITNLSAADGPAFALTQATYYRDTVCKTQTVNL